MSSTEHASNLFYENPRLFIIFSGGLKSAHLMIFPGGLKFSQKKRNKFQVSTKLIRQVLEIGNVPF